MKIKDHGFTLCECAVCLAIISITSVIAVPSFTKIIDKINYRSEITSIVLRLQQARMVAIQTNSPVVLQFEKDHYFVFIDNGEGGGRRGDWKCQENEKVLVLHNLGAGFELSTNFSAGRTRFKGTPGMKAGTITLQNSDGLQTQIVVNTVGRIRTV